MSVSIQSTYATVWEVMKADYPARVRLSTSRKDQDGNYVNSNWFATLFGKAFKKLSLLTPKCRIRINRGLVEHPSVQKEDGTYVNYVNFTIFDFELLGQDGQPIGFNPAESMPAPQQQQAQQQQAPQQPPASDDFPF